MGFFGKWAVKTLLVLLFNWVGWFTMSQNGIVTILAKLGVSATGMAAALQVVLSAALIALLFMLIEWLVGLVVGIVGIVTLGFGIVVALLLMWLVGWLVLSIIALNMPWLLTLTIEPFAFNFFSWPFWQTTLAGLAISLLPISVSIKTTQS